jgi:hypothetical protein
VLHPPCPPLVVHPPAENETDKAPHDEVDGPGWHQTASPTEEHWDIDVLQPMMVREHLGEGPEGHWGKSADEEEPVHLIVVAKITKHTLGPHNTPDDGGIVEDIVSWTCPRAVFWQVVHITDMLDRCQKPPSCAEVHSGGQDCANKLPKEQWKFTPAMINRCKSLIYPATG